MKKFLFTLATLFVAGSAFANSYLYMEKFDAASHIGEPYVTVPIKAHFEEYVSGWEIWFQLPEGIEIDYAEQGSDMSIPYYKQNGREDVLKAPLYFNGPGHYITAVADPGFGTDKVSYGCIKWAPGEYEEYLLVDFIVTEAYAGGDIVIKTEPSCGQDTRFGDEMRAIPETGNTIAWVDESMTAEKPVLTADEALTKVTATDGAQIYRQDGSNPPAWHKVANPFNLPEPTDVEQVINFMACMPNVAGMNGSEFVFLTVTIPAKAQAAPEPTISVSDDYVVTAAVAGETDPETAHTVKLYTVTLDEDGNEVSRQEVENPYTITQTFEDQTIYFVAETVAQDDETENTECAPVKVEVPAKADAQAPKPTITNNNGVVTASAGDLEVELYVKVGENWVLVEDGSFELPENNTFDDVTYEFKAIAKADGENYNIDSEEATASFTVDGKEDAQAPKPTITNTNGVVTASAGDLAVELYVKVGEEWQLVEDGSFELPENNTFDDVTYEFKAIAKADGVNYNVDSAEATASFTVDGKEDAQAPKPTFEVRDGKLYAVSTEGLEVVLMLDGEEVPNGYPLPTENPSYTDDIVLNFTAYAKADGVNYNVNSDEAEYPFVLEHQTKKEAQKPTIVGTNLTNTTKDIVITPDPNTDGTLVVEANPAAPGRAAAQTMTYERKDADYYVHVKAWTTEGDTYLASEVAEEDILIPAKPAPEVIELPDPTISETHDAANQTTIITITVPENTPEGTVLNYTLTDEDGYVIPASDYTVTATDGKIVITIPNGAETAFVTVTATTTMPNAPEGVVVENGEATKTVEVPQYQQTAAPTIDVSFGGEDGAHYANVTFVNNDAKPATIEYSLDNGETWLPYTGAPVVVREYGEVTVLARATAEGKATSEVAERSFMLNDDATSVNELVNGKTVAGVRYFNMAGQEMQEANGITIVVTTYTDGTTSAVKVMK